MNRNNLKALLIVTCCLVAALWSEAQCMETVEAEPTTTIQEMLENIDSHCTSILESFGILKEFDIILLSTERDALKEINDVLIGYKLILKNMGEPNPQQPYFLVTGNNLAPVDSMIVATIIHEAIRKLSDQLNLTVEQIIQRGMG